MPGGAGADLLEHGVRKLRRLVRRVKAAGAAKRTRFRDRSRSAGGRLKNISRTLRRRTGKALGEIDRLTGEIVTVARATLRVARHDSSATGLVALVHIAIRNCFKDRQVLWRRSGRRAQ